MGGMRAAGRAELLDHELFGLLFLVLGGRIVAPFTTIACQTYQISHQSLDQSLWRAARGRQIPKAHDGIRTRDLFLTKEVLYRLSYMGLISSLVPPIGGAPARRGPIYLMERETGFEPATPSLEGSRSTN